MSDRTPASRLEIRLLVSLNLGPFIVLYFVKFTKFPNVARNAYHIGLYRPLGVLLRIQHCFDDEHRAHVWERRTVVAVQLPVPLWWAEETALGPECRQIPKTFVPTRLQCQAVKYERSSSFQFDTDLR
jgi:hypothetical protein